MERERDEAPRRDVLLPHIEAPLRDALLRHIGELIDASDDTIQRSQDIYDRLARGEKLSDILAELDALDAIDEPAADAGDG